MKLQTRSGDIIDVKLTTEHPMSHYGLPVLTDEAGNAFGSLETLGWIVEQATPGRGGRCTWRATRA